VTVGATLFWLAFEPTTYTLPRSRAAWNTPSPAASAFWNSTSAPRPIWASACSFPALTSSQLPMNADSTRTRGLDARAPAEKAAKLAFTGGSSVPPITPTTFVRVIRPANTPAR
jgi:hypothetical protein